MRKQVEKLMGMPIPKHLDFILQRGIVAGKSAEDIAAQIKRQAMQDTSRFYHYG